ISHDVYFIRALANHVVHVIAGQLTHYPGGYQYYPDKTRAKSERAGLTAGVGTGQATLWTTSVKAKNNFDAEPATLSRKEQKRLEAEERQARSRVRKAQQQLVQELEQQIQALE